jgi:cell division cycle protein 20 (cofactor of APC complex)
MSELLIYHNVPFYITTILGVGDSEGSVQLWDVANTKLVRTMTGHTDRITSLDWNAHILVSGGRTGAIHMHDVRVAQHLVATLSAHTQEVCGLTWSPDGKLLASGGNDNTVYLWDPAEPNKPVSSISEHQSAVKALSWCPWQRGVLATAGGTVDRTIRIWNTQSMSQLHHIDTGSQVSSIVWNAEYKELVSGHGFSQNQLTVWKYPSLTKVADLTGHSSRVLLLVCSPDGSTVASVAGDETIRLWKIWPLQQKTQKKSEKSSHPVSMLSQRIR